jgi:hypothetical protein
MLRILDRILSPVFDPPARVLVSLVWSLDNRVHKH